jgi:hypothetical protein
MGMGLFADLRLTHLIPRSRLEEPYLLSLIESITCSVVLLKAARAQLTLPAKGGNCRHFLQRLRRQFTSGTLNRKVFESQMRGEDRAHALLANPEMASHAEKVHIQG